MTFCQHFVGQLLRFSRASQWQKQPEPIAATLQAVAGFLSPQLIAKRIRLGLHLDTANGARVLADRNQLEALFLILLSNAADAVRPDGNIHVRCEQFDKGHIEVHIVDDGCGIESYVLPHIFEPFFTTKAPGTGTGLGLAIASNILQNHGGSVRFQTAPQCGTTAIVDLPLWQEMPSGGKP
jgi:signal transduction histidine kinase